jgi:hypothetical protein
MKIAGSDTPIFRRGRGRGRIPSVAERVGNGVCFIIKDGAGKGLKNSDMLLLYQFFNAILQNI